MDFGLCWQALLRHRRERRHRAPTALALAAVITFLASVRESYVTGTMIPVGGGLWLLDLK